MHTQFRKFLLLLLVITGMAKSSSGQGTLQGYVTDSVTRQPLALSTITVYSSADTSIITYRLSNSKGSFSINQLPLERALMVIVSHSGYQVMRKSFRFFDDTRSINLDTILLAPSMIEMEELVLVAERPPIIVRNDTIEFNANSFRTLPADLVEDLLKKLPGVEIGRDGGIQFNGRNVNRIMLDGKEFFGGDPKLATRNLPALIIDKVQVLDDQEQLDMNPDIGLEALGLVVNLKLKKEIKKGLFGKLYAGAGTDDRWETGALLNTFRDTLQVSILGFHNNLNRAAFEFQDIMSLGGFSRSGAGTMGVSAGGGISIDGIGFGGIGEGILTSTGLGANVNHELGKKASVNLRYFYGDVRSDFQRIADKTQFVDDIVLNSRQDESSKSHQRQHSFGGKLRWQSGPLTTITFRPSLNLANRRVEQQMFGETLQTHQEILNTSQNRNAGYNKNMGYEHTLNLVRKYKRKGQQLSFANNIRIGNNRDEQYNLASTIFTGVPPDTSLLDQLRLFSLRSVQVNMNIAYFHPISNTMTLRIFNDNSFSNYSHDLRTLNPDSQGKYALLNDTLTNVIDRKVFRDNTRLAILWTKGKFYLGPVLSFHALFFRNNLTTGQKVNQQFFYLFPGIEAQLGSTRFSYSITPDEPAVNDLQPIVDNTNPLFLRRGNASLVPAKRHYFYLHFFKPNVAKNLTYRLFSNLAIVEDAFVERRFLNDKGVQSVETINLSGYRRGQFEASLTRQFRFRNGSRLSVSPVFNSSLTRSRIWLNDIDAAANILSLGPYLRVSASLKEKIDLEARYNLRYSKSWYSDERFTGLDATTHSLWSQLTLRLPAGFIFQSDIDYFINPGENQQLSTSRTLFNMGLSWMFLKKKKGLLKLYAYDVLNQNKQLNRTVSENFIIDQQTTVLRRYFLLTFSYNIRNFSAKKPGTSFNLF